MKTVILFLVGGLLLGASALGIGSVVCEHDVWLLGGTAFALTFLPAAATLAWVTLSYRSSPDLQLLASLGGNGVRMVVAAGGGFVFTRSQPQTDSTPFWVWLLAFYFVFLAAEVTLVVRQQPKLDGPPQA